MAKKKFLLLLILAAFFPIFYTQNTSAVSVTSATPLPDAKLPNPVDPTPGCGIGVPVGSQSQWSMTFSDGWKANGVFACGKPGCPATNAFKDSTPPCSSGCCNVVIEPVQSGAQTAVGQVCKDDPGNPPPPPPPSNDTCTRTLAGLAVNESTKKFIHTDGEKDSYLPVNTIYKFDSPNGGSAKSCDGLSLDVSNSSIPGYEFVGWSDTFPDIKIKGTGSNYSKFVNEELVFVFAVYKKKSTTETRTLTIKAVDTNGNSMSSLSDKKTTVDKGKSTSITRRSAPDNYKFVGFRKKATGKNVNSFTVGSTNLTVDGTKLTTNALNNNVTAYAVYEYSPPPPPPPPPPKEFQLIIRQAAGTSITVNRTSTTGEDAKTGNLSNGATLYDGDKLTASYSLSAGYSWGNKNWSGNSYRWGWRLNSQTGPSSSDVHTGTTINHTVSSGVIAETQAVRDIFQGYAKVTSGSATKNTGYTYYNTSTGNLEVECLNSGCGFNFELWLKNAQGTGKTTYTLYRSKNGSAMSVVKSPVSNYQPSTSGTKVGTYNETLKPGETVCYEVRFIPFGPYSNTDIRGVSACGHAKESTFEAKINSDTATTGWKSTNYKGVRNINNCSPINGCTVSFAEQMRRTNGIASSDGYVISRTSNYWGSIKGVKLGASPGNNTPKTLATGNFNPGTNAGINGDGSIKTLSTSPTSSDGVGSKWRLLPGMVICESIKFKPNNNVVKNTQPVTVTLCDYALGDAQPPDPSNPDTPDTIDPSDPTVSSAFLNIKVRTNNPKFPKYQSTVYAKPEDYLFYRSTYNPRLQYSYSILSHKVCFDSSSSCYPTSGVNTTSTLQSLFNTYKGSSRRNWSNSYHITTNGTFRLNDQNVITHVYTPGDISLKINTQPGVRVQPEHAGKTLDEYAQTNVTTTVQTTPKQVTFSEKDGNSVGIVDTRQTSKFTASARIPYNFRTTSSITTPPDDGTIYSGEEVKVSYEISVIPKPNSLTSNTDYATPAPIYHKLIVFVPGASTPIIGTASYPSSGGSVNQNLCAYYGLPNNEVTCGYTAVKDDTFNSGSNFSLQNGHTHSGLTTTFYAQDLRAGSRICVSVASYPSTSGADNNLDRNGDRSWRISKAHCYTVAKRPSLQVWGGAIFSQGQISTKPSVKNNVAGYTSYSVRAKNPNSYVFGSWGEAGLISSGSVIGFASGAGTGYARNNVSSSVWPNPKPADGAGNNSSPYFSYGPGGSVEGVISICHRSTLTFANSQCNNGILGSVGTTAAVSGTDGDKSAIIGKLAFGDTVNVSGTVTLNDATKKRSEGNNIYYYYGGNNSITVPSATIDKGTTQIVHSKNNITISGNLIYGGTYARLSEVPKLVIYAKNIIVNCNVERIDALLVAEENIKTCTSDNVNARDNSYQLQINGAIISNSFTANRTYGAATGANSIVPAEIINYDPTLYSWGDQDDDDDDDANKNYNTTFFREVSPRY
ncbi:hypothetical protein IKF57_00040 [Candidatus Saccharibacteria bacterium]|nr:hypothetical protein [Candidatus Saccharibacteria bacterium]